MEIGIGLPTTIPGATREQVLEWARRADAAGFSSVGTLDRLVYANYEPLVALAAAAAVTERARLLTAILLMPWRQNAALLAKQAASLQALSNGRLVLGVGVGYRADDFEASGMGLEGRGRRMDQMLSEMRDIWTGSERGVAGGIGPDVSGGPPSLIIGGGADAALRRAAEYGDGWIMAAGPPEFFAEPRDKVRAAFRDAGRSDPPRLLAQSYFSLDDDPDGQVSATIADYYGFLGEHADTAAGVAAKGEEAVAERVRVFEEAGCDELVLFPASTDPEQVDKLAALVL